jgi:glutathione synthase/RimK-type ligase-like ATP-grasp enzyme
MARINLIPDTNSSGQLHLHQKIIDQLGLTTHQNIRLRFGIQSCPITIKSHTEINEQKAILSQDSMNQLMIPVSSRYELIFGNGELCLGPYISFLATHKLEELSRYLVNLRDYTTFYDEIGGVFLAFALEGINPLSKTVKGYIYNPRTTNWELGTYPYPSSIFIRGHVASPVWCRHFKAMLGNSIFNDFYFDKWEMYKLLKSSESIRKHLPYTIPFKPGNLLAFIQTYPEAYIKPVHGTMGASILKASRTIQGITVTFRQHGRIRNLNLDNKEKINQFFAIKAKKKRYILQQGLQLLTHRQRMVDFRLIVVKNRFGQWEYMGMVARFGAQRSFLSNISTGGSAEMGEAALKKVLNISELEVKEISNKMSQLALDIAHFLDRSGLHCGNLGIDLGIDRDRKIWIIEIQHFSPAHSIALDAGNEEMYIGILRNHLHYLKRLAGFSQPHHLEKSILKGESE